LVTCSEINESKEIWKGSDVPLNTNLTIGVKEKL